MATFAKQVSQGSPVTLMSSELAGIGSGDGVTSSSSFNNVIGTANLDGYPVGLFELSLGAPSATIPEKSGAFNMWFLCSLDGTTFEDVGPNGYPSREPDIIFYPENLSGAQRKMVRAPLPVGKFKVCLLPLGLGPTVTLNSTNTLKVLAQTLEQV